MKRVIASLFVAVPVLLSGCNAGPLEEEGAPESSLETGGIEQQVVVLTGTGVFDDGNGRITYKVENLGDSGKVRFVLQTANSITWWKSLDLFANAGTNPVHVNRIETKDSVHSTEVDYLAGYMPDSYTLELWKAGVFNIGIKVRTLELSKSDTLGKKITFRWERD